MDSIKVIPIGIQNYIYSFLTDTFINYEFLSVILFVMILVELVKRQWLIPSNVSPRVYVFVTLGFSFLGALLITQFTFSRLFFFKFILLVAGADLIYTLFGYKLLDWVISWFMGIFKGKESDNGTN